MNNLKQFLGGLLQRVEEAGAPSEHAATWQKLLELGDVIAAVPELQQAMRRDDAHAMNAFATLLMLGKGIERDKQGAASWFRQAAVRGHVSAQGSFGICLATGTGLEKNETEAAYWLYRAGKAGNRKAVEALKQVTMRNCATVGPHFSQRDLYVLIRDSQRLSWTAKAMVK